MKHILNFIVYVITDFNGNFVKTGVANKMSDIIKIEIPSHKFFYEGDLHNLAQFCYRGLYSINVNIHKRSINLLKE